MATQDTQFIGRTETLIWLKRQVLGWGHEQSESVIVLLHGDEGVGKTTVVERFLQQSSEEDSLRAANFYLKGPVRPPSLSYFAQLLLHTVSTTIPELIERNDCLQLKINENRAGGGRETSADTYTIHGSARDSGPPLYPESGEEKEIAEACVRSIADWLGKGKVLSKLGLDSQFRLIFIFDGFDMYPTPVKNWLGRYFFPALDRHDNIPQLAMLLTARQSWESGGQGDYWEAPPGAFHQHRLEPQTRHECEEWLKAAGMRLSLVDVLYEETEGYPARIVHALKDTEGLEKRKNPVGDPDDPLSFFTAKERRWLHAAAMIRAVSLETLQVLLGKLEGTQAFGWLAGHIEFCQVERNLEMESLLVLSDHMRKNILSRTLSKLPVRQREFQDKIGLIADIQSRVRSPLHRENLRLLTPLQPMNRELIREVFKGYA